MLIYFVVPFYVLLLCIELIRTKSLLSTRRRMASSRKVETTFYDLGTSRIVISVWLVCSIALSIDVVYLLISGQAPDQRRYTNMIVLFIVAAIYHHVYLAYWGDVDHIEFG